MKRITIFILLLSLSSLLFSFTNSNTNEWELFKEENGVKIFKKQINCEVRKGIENTFLIFKYENTSNAVRSLSWRVDLYFNGNCRSCNVPSPNEYEVKMTLNPGEVKEGDCNSNSHAFKVYFANPNKAMAGLEKVEFTNLIVK